MSQDHRELSRYEAWMLIAGTFLVACLRSPILLLQGRVTAEEGTDYLQKAWESKPLAGLLAIEQGYYSLLTNIVAFLAAKCFPLEQAGRVFVTSGLLVLLWTVFIVAACELFRSPRERAIAIAILLLTPAVEVWMVFVDGQFYLLLCTAFICLSDETRHRALRTLTVLVAGLTGPVSCALSPFYLYRAYKRRTGPAILQAAILTACSIFQATTLAVSLHTGARSLVSAQTARWYGPILFEKIFALTALGRLGFYGVSLVLLRKPIAAIYISFWILSLIGFALWWIVAKMSGTPGKMCFVMAIAILCFDCIGVPDTSAGLAAGANRYFYAPLALLWFTLFFAATRAPVGRARSVVRTWLAVCLLWGLLDTGIYWKHFQNLDPRWKDQVAAWRVDPSTPIHVPPPFWHPTLHLQPR